MNVPDGPALTTVRTRMEVTAALVICVTQRVEIIVTLISVSLMDAVTTLAT